MNIPQQRWRDEQSKGAGYGPHPKSSLPWPGWRFSRAVNFDAAYKHLVHPPNFRGKAAGHLARAIDLAMQS